MGDLEFSRAETVGRISPSNLSLSFSLITFSEPAEPNLGKIWSNMSAKLSNHARVWWHAGSYDVTVTYFRPGRWYGARAPSFTCHERDGTGGGRRGRVNERNRTRLNREFFSFYYSLASARFSARVIRGASVARSPEAADRSR